MYSCTQTLFQFFKPPKPVVRNLNIKKDKDECSERAISFVRVGPTWFLGMTAALKFLMIIPPKKKTCTFNVDPLVPYKLGRRRYLCARRKIHAKNTEAGAGESGS